MIKKGDNVIITAGKDKGKKGKVVRVFPDRNRVLVEGLNSFKKHQRARSGGGKGQVVDVTHPMHASNMQVVDPKTGKATRIGAKKVGDKKVRIARKSGQEI